MKRERKYAWIWTGIGVLTLPLWIGIPLLVAGIVLFATGECVKRERWIQGLFWPVVAALVVGGVLVWTVPLDKPRDAEHGIAMSLLCVLPVALAVSISLALAALTLAWFPCLSRGYRLMGLGFGALSVCAGCVALAVAFPWVVAAGIVLLSGALALLGWRKRRRAWRLRVPPLPSAGTEKRVATLPEMPPVVAVPATPRAPRVRKPVCGVSAWVLPVVAAPLGLLLVRGANAADYPGFGLLGLAFAPLFLGLCLSPVLALIALWRRERHPFVPGILLGIYGIGLSFSLLDGRVALGVVLLGLCMLVAWLVRQLRRKRV